MAMENARIHRMCIKQHHSCCNIEEIIMRVWELVWRHRLLQRIIWFSSAAAHKLRYTSWAHKQSGPATELFVGFSFLKSNDLQLTEQLSADYKYISVKLSTAGQNWRKLNHDIVLREKCRLFQVGLLFMFYLMSVTCYYQEVWTLWYWMNYYSKW